MANLNNTISLEVQPDETNFRNANVVSVLDKEGIFTEESVNKINLGEGRVKLK
jgi:hypothetical protein